MASSSEEAKVCAACRHIRWKCEPDCVFAPYFGPEDGEHFAVLEGVFGASNVSKVLADHDPHERVAAIKRLLYLAAENVLAPAGGRWSSVPWGHGEKPSNQQMAEAQQAAATAQASREQALMMQCHSRTGFGVPAGHLPSCQATEIQQQQTAAAVVTNAWHQDMMMRQAAAAQNYQALGLQQQRQNQQLAEGVRHQNHHTALTAEAAKRATAADAARVREIDTHLQFLRQAAMEEQYMNRYLRTMMQQTVADGQQEHHQLRHDRAGQNDAMRRNAMLQRNIARGLANRQNFDQHIKIQQQYWEKELMMMQKAAANAPAMPGEQPQPQRQTGNAQFQKESSLLPREAGSGSGARTIPLLPERSTNAEAFLVQPRLQPQTVNSFGIIGSQVEPSLPPLPPSLADVPRQQQNDGGNEGQSVDTTLRLWHQ